MWGQEGRFWGDPKELVLQPAQSAINTLSQRPPLQEQLL